MLGAVLESRARDMLRGDSYIFGIHSLLTHHNLPKKTLGPREKIEDDALSP